MDRRETTTIIYVEAEFLPFFWPRSHRVGRLDRTEIERRFSPEQGKKKVRLMDKIGRKVAGWIQDSS